ncbi:hypothetical protein HFD91_07065 [Enterobacteriaceae bacterium EKM102V]|uniref:hypothetical protein n=1 Tax=Pantoea TaxID=53335 RepID=UPI000B285D82|nr:MULTISPECIES: hypothetical protein [Pantoea]KAF6661142.1 hypothetical protein HFD91_07065 [Enterobacteriaceae bacterium EKM102V]KAF6668348.1 hypothetical protein HFD97_09990 [Pantoea sp. EKM103V]
MKSAMMVLIILPFCCLVISFILYLVNRSQYQRLISDFQKGRTLPAPYLFQCNMGYLGSPLMTWFFIRLKDKKKIFFLEQKSQNYDFASERKNQERIDSLKPLYYTFLAGFFCCFLLAFIAILIRFNVV